ncbi:DUF6894 family protein [Bradyrhizobium sp. JYMT SZCCT0428]|uniref:DUF6894 family protein n=1 Tax=Bradyrhizobium sp. JYMT SZCCT0428 TaxID=2807673 RepID=UPI001BA8EFDF|nr:hypothetical protein [Bradyrhizobium sp. JYMT SZCCT0428]MBR1153620.1 hypothetical protein [Bradyrhizobium sp. JYMT SZCCT0428]
MPRYYFDLREGDQIAPDEEGLEFDSLDQVQVEAARSLAELARDAIRRTPHSLSYQKSVEVRDDNGPVMEARFTYKLEKK